MFKRSDDFDLLYNTHLVGHVNIAPAKLRKIFGEPDCGDDYKISGEYLFVSVDGDAVFSIYDWKSTSLYDGIDPSPAEFWASEYPHEFNIGGQDNKHLAAFRQFILSHL